MLFERTYAPGLPADRDRYLDIAVVDVRSHTDEVLNVYLIDSDIENLMEFLCRKHD